MPQRNWWLHKHPIVQHSNRSLDQPSRNSPNYKPRNRWPSTKCFVQFLDIEKRRHLLEVRLTSFSTDISRKPRIWEFSLLLICFMFRSSYKYNYEIEDVLVQCPMSSEIHSIVHMYIVNICSPHLHIIDDLEVGPGNINSHAPLHWPRLLNMPASSF